MKPVSTLTPPQKPGGSGGRAEMLPLPCWSTLREGHPASPLSSFCPDKLTFKFQAVPSVEI